MIISNKKINKKVDVLGEREKIHNKDYSFKEFLPDFFNIKGFQNKNTTTDGDSERDVWYEKINGDYCIGRLNLDTHEYTNYSTISSSYLSIVSLLYHILEHHDVIRLQLPFCSFH